MSEKDAWRQLDDGRIIPEKTYQSEKSFAEGMGAVYDTPLGRAYLEKGFWKLTFIISFLALIGLTWGWSIGWFWKLLIVFIGSVMVTLFLIPGIYVILLILIIWVMYKLGAF